MPLLDEKVAQMTGGGSEIGQAACHFYIDILIARIHPLEKSQ
jgi:hypothetical protein